jgi:CheY-like chemotaxis protein
MLRRLLSQGTELAFQAAATPCAAWVDPGQLTQVLMNLVINARDALPEGGRIQVAVASSELSEAHLLGHARARPGRFAVLSVSDNGQGMDAETQARVFEPFFSTKARGRGTGLGLATVYSIVEQAGGIVALQSAPGQGATFKVYLPLASAPAPRTDWRGGGQEGILLVEPDPDVRTFARGILSEAGYRVSEAVSSAEALDQGLADPPDLLVAEWGPLPVDGPGLLERLRRAVPSLRALFLSDGALGPQPGLNGHAALLAKPFSPAGLAAAVRQVLDRAAALREGAEP